jgi:hypothetical protein
MLPAKFGSIWPSCFRGEDFLPRAILVSDWLLFNKIFSSETAWQNGAKLGRMHLCKILYKASSFGSIPPTNKMGNQIYFKIAGHVDLDKLNMFSVYTQHLSLIVFEKG